MTDDRTATDRPETRARTGYGVSEQWGLCVTVGPHPRMSVPYDRREFPETRTRRPVRLIVRDTAQGTFVLSANTLL